MTELQYRKQQILNDVTLPKQVREAQANYIDRFGVSSHSDLYTIEIYRSSFEGKANKSFRENYIVLLNASIENNKRLTEEDWEIFFNTPVEYTEEGSIQYADT